MDKKWENLKRKEEKYMKTHDTMFVCPYCNAFLVPWSWDGNREKAKTGYVFQYVCQCNLSKRKGSPSWYETIEKKRRSDWYFFNGIQWTNPSKVPILFNPSVR
jgi:transcription elongation factor Elf1